MSLPVAVVEQDSSLHGTILVVDDEASIRFILKRMLEYLGCSVIIAEDGMKALEIYEAIGERVDLVIVDISMPRMGGEVLIDHLLGVNPEARVLVSSGYSQGDRESDALSRAVGYLEKPYTLDQLHKKVRQCLE